MTADAEDAHLRQATAESAEGWVHLTALSPEGPSYVTGALPNGNGA